MRDEAEYCSNRCRSAAFQERAHEGKVASVRRLTSGKVSYVIHCDRPIGAIAGETVKIR